VDGSARLIPPTYVLLLALLARPGRRSGGLHAAPGVTPSGPCACSWRRSDGGIAALNLGMPKGCSGNPGSLTGWGGKPSH